MDTALELILQGLIVASIGLFVLGSVRPDWIWRWGREPNRLAIQGVALAVFMAGFTGLGMVGPEAYTVEKQLQAEVLGKAAYTSDTHPHTCEPGSRSGAPGKTDDKVTRDGIKYNVRTPVNYDATRAHPLLMVYAPAGKNRVRAERFMHLTLQGTTAGFIVAYADNRPLAPEAIIELASIPRGISETWCVDVSRIFLTGHSDGGSVSMGMAFINGTKDIPAAIAPSAAGIRGDDLLDRNCPGPLPVMVMHSARDSLFPGYGSQAAKWWANCNGCDLLDPEDLPNGCTAFRNCSDGAPTWYCEGSGVHSSWPERNEDIIAFLTRVRPRATMQSANGQSR